MKAIVPAWRANSISQNWFNEFDQFFNDLFEQGPNRQMGLACDIEESEKYILFSFDLPGLDEKDIHIELNDGVLHISGERSEELSSEASKSFRGRRYGKFEQRFRIPKSVNLEAIEADYTNGVLKVLLPKVEADKPKRVEVKAKKGGFFSELLKSGPKES